MQDDICANTCWQSVRTTFTLYLVHNLSFPLLKRRQLSYRVYRCSRYHYLLLATLGRTEDRSFRIEFNSAHPETAARHSQIRAPQLTFICLAHQNIGAIICGNLSIDSWKRLIIWLSIVRLQIVYVFQKNLWKNNVRNKIYQRFHMEFRRP